MDKQMMIECYECEAVLIIDEQDDPDEIEDWGRYAAECIECGAKYRRLERNLDKSWTDDQGRRLNPA